MALAAYLTDSAAARMRDANDPARLDTALNWLGRLQASQPSRVLFLPPRGSMDQIDKAHAHNARTFSDLSEFIRVHGSIQPGRLGATVQADAISGYVSAIRSALGLAANRAITSAAHAARPRQQAKHMRLDDGPAGQRLRRLGIQGLHLAQLAVTPRWDLASEEGSLRWTSMGTAKSCLLRAGEVGMPDNRVEFDWRRGITLADFHAPSGSGSFVWLSELQVGASNPQLVGHRGLILMITPIKDGGTKKTQRKPVPIAALHPGEPSDDPLCVYSLLCRWWRFRSACTAGQPPHTVPLFARRDGTVITSKDVDRFAHDAFSALGIEPDETGGVAFRIGGATDVRQKEGIEAGKELLKERGRWASDIGWIYQRGDVGAQLGLSIRMTEGGGVATETLLPGWSQPALR